MPKIYLSIILPVFNEEKRIIRGLEKVQEFFEKEPYSYEALIVNNGSWDKTEKLALNFIKGKENWKFLSLPYPAKGEAVKIGILKSSGDNVLFTDIDLPVPLRELDKFWEVIKENDFVIASKYLPESRPLKPVPLSRKLAGRIFNFLTRQLLNLSFADTQCGFKLLRRKPMLPLIKNLRTKGFCFDIELLLKAQSAGLKIKEMPVQWSNPKGSRIKLSKESISMFLDLLKIWIRSKIF